MRNDSGLSQTERQRSFKRVLFWVLLAALAMPAMCFATHGRTAKDVESVLVSGALAGHMTFWEEEYRIQRRDDEFIGSGSLRVRELPQSDRTTEFRSRVVPRDVVERAIDELLSAPVSEAGALEHMVTPELVRASADEAAKLATCSPEARDKIRSRFDDPERVRKAFASSFGIGASHSISTLVTIFFSDGSRVEYRRTGDYLGLPWRGSAGSSWNWKIAPAVASLLPARSRTRGGLEGGDASFKQDFRRSVVGGDDAAWQELEARCQFRAEISQVQAMGFNVVSASVNGHRSMGLTLSREGMPSNLAVSLIVLETGSRSARRQMEQFQARIQDYLQLATPFAIARPDHRWVLDMYKGRSFDDFDLEIRASERQQERLRPHADRISILQNAGDYLETWAVLPDGEVLKLGE